MGFGEAGEVGEFEGAVGAAVVAVFGCVVDEGVGAGAAVVGVVVDCEAGEGFDEEEFAGAAAVAGAVAGMLGLDAAGVAAPELSS